MAFFNKMKDPVFLKESSHLDKQIRILQELMPRLNKEGQEKASQELKFLEYGSVGEKNIAFELKNSHMPMYIMMDLYLVHDGLSAQIDYLVVTGKLVFVIECKNLYGNIEINSQGDFIRSMTFGNKTVKEGIYSPITQNQRHLELLNRIKRDKQSNAIMKFIYDKVTANMYKSVVVLANPKTVVNMKYAKKETKEQVIRADQLIKFIKDENEKSKYESSNDNDMRIWAESFLSMHVNNIEDYSKKYAEYIVGENAQPQDKQSAEAVRKIEFEDVKTDIFVEEGELYQALKAFRLNKSREEKIKPYFIFNDAQLQDLMTKKPKTKEELLEVAGFGPVKVEKYGKEILNLLIV